MTDRPLPSRVNPLGFRMRTYSPPHHLIPSVYNIQVPRISLSLFSFFFVLAFQTGFIDHYYAKLYTMQRPCSLPFTYRKMRRRPGFLDLTDKLHIGSLPNKC